MGVDGLRAPSPFVRRQYLVPVLVEGHETSGNPTSTIDRNEGGSSWPIVG
jgi:hypothetical protein